MATPSSTLAWRIPWTEEPGGLWSMGSHRVRHAWSDLACPRMLVERVFMAGVLHSPWVCSLHYSTHHRATGSSVFEIAFSCISQQVHAL